MLGSMRSKKGSVGVWIILGLLFVGLIGFGIGGTGGISRSSVGTVGDTQISISTYVSTLNNARQFYARQTGRLPGFTEMQAAGLFNNVLDDAVRGTALDNLNSELGISIGDEAVREAILNNPSFQALDGTFNETSYTFFLDQNNLTTGEYETLLRASLARFLLESTVSNGVNAPSTSAEAIISYAFEEREATFIVLGEEDLADPIAEIDDEAAQAYYDDNPDAFQSLETKQITYAWLTPDNLESVEISEDELRLEYETQRNRYILPERRAVERLIYSNEADAQAALDRVTSGEVDFAALVAERGLTTNDIDLGIVERDQVSADAAQVIFGDIEPGVFGPIADDLGSALYYVSAVLNSQTIPFEEAEAELRAELAAIARSDVINNLVPTADDLLVAGATIEELASETDMQLGTIAFNAESTEAIAAYGAFRDEANKALEGDFPELYTLSDGGIFALRVDEVIPAGTRPFEEVRDAAKEGARNAAVEAALAELAETLIDRVAAGESIYSLGFASSSVAGLNRGVPTSDFSAEEITEIFEAEADGFVTLPRTAGLVLVRVDEITPPELGDAETRDIISRVQTELGRGMAQDLLLSFADAASEEAGVSLDFIAIEQINTQLVGGPTGF